MIVSPVNALTLFFSATVAKKLNSCFDLSAGLPKMSIRRLQLIQTSAAPTLLLKERAYYSVN